MAPAETIDLSDAVTQSSDGPEDAAAAKKREENRKKRERQKAKKAADKVATKDDPASVGRWQKGALPSGKAERRDAGGGTRGLGVFARECLCSGDVFAAAAPALSCIFDEAADKVCSFCFAEPEPGAMTEHTVTLRTTDPDESGKSTFGLKLDDYRAPDTAADDAAVVLITAVTKESPNREDVRIGDRLASVDGVPVTGGHEGAVPALLDGAKKHGGSVECVVRRPALTVCQGCRRHACCAKCVGEGRLAWHAYECKLYQCLPAQAKQGETATLRLLMRYKVATEPKIGDWPHEAKEPVAQLTSLQANACDVPAEQLMQLSRLTAVPASSVASLIYQVRTNACEITRGGRKVGCALSVLMGWHNHDCTPSAKSVIAPDGCVSLATLRDVKEGEEITISYVDQSAPYDERRKTLQQHYGFECKCARCVTEQRKDLKSKMHQRDQYMQAQRR